MTRTERAQAQRAAYTVEITRRDESGTAAYVSKADGTRYGVRVGSGFAVCSCPDSMYRQTRCKHAEILTLHLQSA